MYLRPISIAAAAALVVLAGCTPPSMAPAVKATPRSAAPTGQSADIEFSRRVERFEGLISAPHPAAFMSEYLDVQPGQAPGLVRPLAVIHIVYDERLFFAGAGNVLRPQSSALLDLWAKAIKQDAPGVRLTLLIHTDAHGSEKFDDDMSSQRAGNILQALIDRGIAPAALSAVVIGKRQPIANNMTAQSAMRNRRVEFLFSIDLDANLAVVRLHPIDRAFLTAKGAPVAPESKTNVQVMRPEFAAAGYGGSGARIVMRPAGMIELQAAADHPGPSPIPRQPILREGASNWPDPPEPPDSPAP
jgi:outer membrane protein OmpA-like peptidoglycan-associated protein